MEETAKKVKLTVSGAANMMDGTCEYAPGDEIHLRTYFVYDADLKVSVEPPTPLRQEYTDSNDYAFVLTMPDYDVTISFSFRPSMMRMPMPQDPDMGGGSGAMGSPMMGMGMGLMGMMQQQMADMNAAPKQENDTETKTCPSCGETIPARVKFCPNCGAIAVKAE